MKGKSVPRLHNPDPLPGRRRGESKPAGCPCGCGLSRSTTKGFKVIDWAARRGWRLFGWQRWLYIHALELDAECVNLRFRIVVVLVARQNGKTYAKMIKTLFSMYAENSRLCVGTAQDLSLAREVMNEGLIPMILDHDFLRKRFDPEWEPENVWDPSERSRLISANRRGVWKKRTNDEYFRLDSRWSGGRAISPHGPRYLIKALNRKAGRGLWEAAEVNIDELREQYDFAGWAAVSKVIAATDNGQIWCMSNAGDKKSVVLNHLRSVGLSGADEQMFIAEWSAPKELEMDDPRGWAQANPSLGFAGGRTVGSLRSALVTDPPAVFRTEDLCQFVDSMNSAVDMIAWGMLADVGGELGDRAALCVAVSTEADHVSAVVASKLEDGRVRVRVAGEWSSTMAARRELPDLVQLFRPAVAGWYPNGPGAALSAAMKKLKGSAPIQGLDVSSAHMTFADYVESRRVLQPGNPMLDEHMALVGKVEASTRRWQFEQGLEATDGAWAAAGAVHLVLNMPERRKRSHRVIVASGAVEG